MHLHQFILTAAALLQLTHLTAQPMAEVADERILSFEQSAAPFTAGDGSSLSLTGMHYKHGEHSLLWRWDREGAQISLHAPIGYLSDNPNPRETSVSTFVFWVYAPQALQGRLHFEFRKNGKTCSEFRYNLGFTGWRGAWVSFDRDMEGEPDEEMDELVITTEGTAGGEICLDHLILSSFQDVRYHTADLQAPFINAATTSHWLVLLQSWNKEMTEKASEMTVEEQRDIKTIEERLRMLLLEGKKPTAIKYLQKQFSEYGITENPDGTVRGKPIWFIRYAETYINLGYPDVAKLYEQNRQTLRRYNDLMFQIAVSHAFSESGTERAELERMYLMMTRHLLDQGFAAGSAQGTLHHLGYSMRNFYTAPVIMRSVLEKAGLLHDVQQAMEWFSGVGEVKTPPAVAGMDIDAFNTSLTGRLASIVMMPDSPSKVAWMRAFSRWVDNGYKVTEGTSPCFKSDGTVFHHRRHYPAYAVDGFSGGAVNAVWMLAKTRFAISAESHEILKRALLEMRFYCNLASFPLAMSGRHPDGKGALIPWHYGRLANAGSPDGSEDTDTELAAAYLRLTGGEGDYAAAFKDKGIAAEASPQGTHVYGYNASLSHRRSDWLVTIAGHSRYLWSAEIYRGANHYGRYLTHGSMQLLGSGNPVSAFGSGFRQEGWDWCHIPGTTALVLPMEQMKADIRNVDTFSGYEEMLLSDESFVGGVSHKGENGMFSMKLHEHDKYNGSLRAIKTFFLFDNRIICLGSDITNEAEGSVHTTLFQNHIGNGAESGSRKRRIVKNGVYDNLGNLYLVYKGSDRLHITEGLQHSLHEETDQPTENRFHKAYIDHGSGKIEGGEYEYMAVIAVPEREARRIAAKKPYEVLQCDSRAHIVHDYDTGVTACAIFCGGAIGHGPATAVSLPSLIMTSEEGERMTISVADPDLRLYEGASDDIFDEQGKRIERSVYSRSWIDNPSAESELQVTLRGRWHTTDDSVRISAEGDSTVITFRCREGATREVELVKAD